MDQVELEQRLKSVEKRLDEVDKYYNDVRKEFIEMDELGIDNGTKCIICGELKLDNICTADKINCPLRKLKK